MWIFICCLPHLQVLQTERQLAQLTVSGQQALRAAEADAAEQLATAQQAAAARQREAAVQVAELSSKLEAAEASAAGAAGRRCYFGCFITS
jgi:hypothetical protein